MYRISDFKPVAFEAPTSKGRCVRFTARVEPELAFDAYDAATGGALGEIYVWDAHPVRAERQRMMALETGVPPSLLDETALKKAILDALPHQKPTLERYPNMMNSLFLDELREALLKELKRSIHGEQSTEKEIAKARAILSALPNEVPMPKTGQA